MGLAQTENSGDGEKEVDLRAIESWLVRGEIFRNVGIRESQHMAPGLGGDEPSTGNYL